MYPKFKNKHLEEALWHPKNASEINLKIRLPKKYLIIYYDLPFKYLKKKYKIKKIKELSNYSAEVFRYKDNTQTSRSTT